MAERKNKQNILPLAVVACLTLFCQLPCACDINPDLVDQYLQKYFDWAMFIDLQNTKQFLNYPGSQLHPLTQLRVNFRSFPRGKECSNSPATLYEEFWYHQDVPIGLRRQKELDVEEDQSGAIIVGPVDDNSVGAVSNALIRLFVELDIKQAPINVVLVPREKYDQIADGLGRYSFSAKIDVAEGPQPCIHLRSYPWGKEQYLFHHSTL